MKSRLSKVIPKGIFGRAVSLLVLVFILLKLIKPPIPSFVMSIYMAVIVVGILLYITLTEEHISEFLSPLRTLVNQKEKRHLRTAILLISSALITLWTVSQVNPSIKPAAELRTVHPAFPTQIDFRGEKIEISGLENPLRENPEELDAHIRSGATIYYTYCFFCHGDKLDGKGIFANAFSPPPADFTDVGTIAQLQESYLFWRISKGGPGLPRESQPWNSAMPVWENYLTKEEIWQVILFLYHRAGVSPRTWE